MVSAQRAPNLPLLLMSAFHSHREVTLSERRPPRYLQQGHSDYHTTLLPSTVRTTTSIIIDLIVPMAESGENEDSDYFVREFDLESNLGSISFFQKEVGEVNCVVYDSALVLGKYLEKKCLEDENYLSGKRVVELGSGLGCVGLVAAAYGGNVLLTDLPKAMPQLELNVRKNEGIIKLKGGKVETQALDWNSEADSDLEPFDVIVASDCVYYEEGVSGLIKTMLRLSTSTTEIFLSQENRSYSEAQSQVWHFFCEEILNHFKVKIIPVSQQHEDYRSSDIYLIQLMKL